MRGTLLALALCGCGVANIKIDRPSATASRSLSTVALYAFDTQESEVHRPDLANLLLVGCLRATVKQGKKPVDATHVRIRRPRPAPGEWPRLFDKLGPRSGTDAFITGSMISAKKSSDQIQHVEAFLVGKDAVILARATVDAVDAGEPTELGLHLCRELLAAGSAK